MKPGTILLDYKDGCLMKYVGYDNAGGKQGHKFINLSRHIDNSGVWFCTQYHIDRCAVITNLTELEKLVYGVKDE